MAAKPALAPTKPGKPAHDERTNSGTPAAEKISNTSLCDYLENSKAIRLSVMVDATNMCQLDCRYCYYGRKGSQKMNVERVMAAAQNLAAVFQPKLCEINFHYMGGEPLLAWEEILALNALARPVFENTGVAFTWSLTSNLVALDERKAEHMILEKAGIHCSVDGPARIHDKNRPYRGGRPSFADVAKNVPLALRITPNDTARVTVCPEDARFMPEVAETVLGLGFQVVGLFPASGMPWEERDIEDWTEGILKAHEIIGSAHEAGKRISTIVRPHGRRSEHHMTHCGDGTYCGAGKGLWAIDVNGQLCFCHRLTNIPQLAVIDASEGTPQTIRKAIEQSLIPPSERSFPEMCLDCPAKQYCNGGCWADNLLVNGDSCIPDETNCRLRKASAGALKDWLNCPELTNEEICIFSCDKCDSCETCYATCYGRCDSCNDNPSMPEIRM